MRRGSCKRFPAIRTLNKNKLTWGKKSAERVANQTIRVEVDLPGQMVQDC